MKRTVLAARTIESPPYRADYWIAPPVSTTTGTPTVGQMRFTALWVPKATTLKTLSAEVTTAATAASGGVLRINLYADDGHGLPTGAPLLADQTISTESTGTKTFTISYAAQIGYIHVGYVLQVSGCTIRVCQGVSPWVALGSYATNASGVIGPSSITGALPSSPTLSGSGQTAFVTAQMT